MEITIKYDQDQTISAPKGISLAEILKLIPLRSYMPIAALVNGDLQELDYPMHIDSEVQWVDANSAVGWPIYRRSLTFLLLLAIEENFPGFKLWVSHSLSDGLFCWAENAEGIRLTGNDVIVLEQKIREYVDSNMPITRDMVSKEDAVAFFRSENKMKKASLLLRREDAYLGLYRAHNLTDYLFGRMATNAALLQDFRLSPFENGFILQLPRRAYLGSQIQDEHEPKQLHAVLRDYSEWSELLHIRTVSDLNAIIDRGGNAFNELVLIAEALQERVFSKVSDAIVADFPQVRIVLVAGPSSSGKTTTANRLRIQLRTSGLDPIIISMDDYFVDIDKTPPDEFGKPDYEGLTAMDLELFHANMTALLAGKKADLPYYDFKSGKSIPGHRQMALAENQILIVEGIHALNEAVSAYIPKANKRKIFVSALTQINLDASTPFSTSDNRLIRRMVRDGYARGISPEQTLNRWAEVRRGEHRNIFPFQEEADFFINSALIYELPILRPLIEEKLAAITPTSCCYLEASRILRLLRYFSPATDAAVPRSSILQEFIGNSIFNV